MFVCYVPDERASLCYAVEGIVLSGQNSRLRSKSEAKKDSEQSMRRCVFAGFQYVCKFLNDMSAPQQDLRVQVS